MSKRKATMEPSKIFTDDYIRGKELGIKQAEIDYDKNKLLKNFNILSNREYLSGFEDGYNALIIDKRRKLIKSSRHRELDNYYALARENLDTNSETLHKRHKILNENIDFIIELNKNSKESMQQPLPFGFGTQSTSTFNVSSNSSPSFTFGSSSATTTEPPSSSSSFTFGSSATSAQPSSSSPLSIFGSSSATSTEQPEFESKPI